MWCSNSLLFILSFVVWWCFYISFHHVILTSVSLLMFLCGDVLSMLLPGPPKSGALEVFEYITKRHKT